MKITRPPFGSYWRRYQDYIDGVFIIDGERRFRSLGNVEDIFYTPGGRKRTGDQMDKVLLALWDAKREEILTAHPDTASVGALFADWVAMAKTTRAKGTVVWYEAARKAYLAANGDHAIGETTTRHIDRLVQYLSGQDIKPATVNIHLRHVKTFFRWASDREDLGKLPKFEFLSTVRVAPRIPSESDIHRMILNCRVKAAKAANPTRAREHANHELAIWVLALTGLRRGEVLALAWEDIDLNARTIRIKPRGAFTPKGRHEFTTIIQAGLLLVLDRHRAAHPGDVWLLDNGAGEQAFASPGGLTLALTRIQRRMGLEGFKPVHAFRAFRASMLRRHGADLELIRDMLSHSDVRVTAGYFADPSQAARDLIGKIDRKLIETKS